MATYKKIPIEMRDHLAELTPAEWMVWTYMYLRTGKENTAFPSNRTIADATGMNLGTVKTARKGLREKGWFQPVRQLYRDDGGRSTMVEKTTLPWVEKQTMGTVENPPMGMGENSDLPHGRENHPSEVDTDLKQIQGKEDSVEVPSLTDGVSKQDSEYATSSLLADKTEEKPSDLLSEELVSEEAKTTPTPKQVELTAQEQVLLDALLPRHDSDMELDPEVKSKLHGCLFMADTLGVDCEDVLKFNRLHKKGALYIRTLTQFSAALLGSKEGNYTMVNEYIEHQPRNCKECKSSTPDKCPQGYAQMKALKDHERDIKEKREYLANSYNWNYAMPNLDSKKEFLRIIREGKEERGLKNSWKPESFSLDKSVALEYEGQFYCAAVNYVVKRQEYLSFEEFKQAVQEAKDYAKAYHDVRNYDKQQAQGATA